MFAYILSLLSLSNAVVVTHTVYDYATVTVLAPLPTDDVDVNSSSSSNFSETYNSTNATDTNYTSDSASSTILSNLDLQTPLTTTSAETSPDVPQYTEIVVTSTYVPAQENVQQTIESHVETPAAETSVAEATTTPSTSIAPVYTTPVAEPTTAEPETSSTVAAVESSSSSSQQISSDAQDIVDFHNKVRAEHQVGSLTWNQDLANFAQNYLDNSNCNFAHSGGPYGENIAMGYQQNDQAMQAWYDEYQQYDYASGQFSSSTGHFTQMVWKGTTEVGCATINCPGWGPYLACEYTPRGNIIGEFTENVFA